MIQKNFNRVPLAAAVLACCTLTLLALPASAATASQLLEKAIYAEETVGDLDEAIEIYETVLAKSKRSINAAAEAQYRIGTCYAKQGKTDEANAAFQKVIDNYSQATTWVAKAKSSLPGTPELLPVPWGDGDTMIYELKLPTGRGVGHQVFRVKKAEVAGREVWECDAWQTVIINGMFGKSHVLADRETFAPLTSEWSHTMLGESRAKYSDESVAIKMASRSKPLTIDYTGPVYDNEQAAEMFRRLPLKVGFKANIDVIPILTGTKLPLGLEVTDLETIETPVGKFECYRLDLNIQQSFWISNDENRYIVRFEAGGVTADLEEVRAYEPNKSTEVSREHFSATLPPDWFAYTSSGSEGSSKVRTLFISPEITVRALATSVPKAKVSGKHKTARDLLEAGLSDNDEDMVDYELSEAGIQQTTVDGRTAAMAVYDHKDGDKQLRTHRTIVYGDTAALDLRFSSLADDFNKQLPMFEKIVDTIELK